METVHQAEAADKEQALEIVAAFNQAEEERESDETLQDEPDEADDVLDHDDPEAKQDDDLTDAEIAAEKQVIQTLLDRKLRKAK